MKNFGYIISSLYGIKRTSIERFERETNMSLPDILPLEVIDKTINQPVWIILQSNREFTGILRGFDDFVNVIIEDATEWVTTEEKSEKVMEHHGRMLLSGNNINMLVPGGKNDV